MARIFGKYNFRFWVSDEPRTIGYGEEPIQKPARIPTPPAPEDLFKMAVEAIRKHSLASMEEMERTGDFNIGWKHPLEEMLYSGAFSDDQQIVLQEVFSEVAHNVGVAHARVLTTRILCGATEQSKERICITPGGQTLVSGTVGSGSIKGPHAFYTATNQTPWK